MDYFKYFWSGIIVLFTLFSCTSDTTIFSNFSEDNSNESLRNYNDFCSLDTSNYEYNSVKLAIYGEHKKSLHFVSLNQTIGLTHSKGDFLKVDSTQIEFLKVMISELQNPNLDNNKKRELELLRYLIETDFSPSSVFKNVGIKDARQYIINQSRDFNYVLINEAHHSSQNRIFVKSLLKSLYKESGFKYLALEALSWQDSSIMKRGYAVEKSGYYTDDAAYGNLIREALSLGYKLIGYETKKGARGTKRDLEQARNIIEQTQNRTGKTLVYAGYGHINECCLDEPYVPLGAQLKELLGEDILTINQSRMIGFSDTLKEDEFYNYCLNEFGDQIDAPSIIVNEMAEPILSPLGHNTIDLEVYHPRTTFVSGRPDWLQDGRSYYPLSDEILKYKGLFLSVIKPGESFDAVGVDQFIISSSKSLLLHPGEYVGRVINCDGAIIVTFDIIVE